MLVTEHKISSTLKTSKHASSLVIFNTGISYVRMLINMVILLYSTRIVLSALGASDFGIFNLTAGLIGMLSFLSASMTVSTQRYLSFYQGAGNFEMQKKVFRTSWVLHILIGLIAVAFLVAISPILFNDFLNIANDKIGMAKTVYYFTSASVFFTIISVPFIGLLNAHENITYTSIIDIFATFLKLVIALLLQYFIQDKRLVVYGTLMAMLSMISFVLYAFFCLKKYKECNISIYRIDKLLIKELSVYTGWNLFGNFSRLGRVQGLAVLLNIFFGTVVNAAYGIANQVSGQFNFFSATLVRALNPQLMKSEGMNNRERMIQLSMIASKSGFFLLAIIAIPCIFEMPELLKLWLKDPPDKTAVFCSLFLVVLLIEQLTIGLLSAVQSVGKVKAYQLLIGGLWLFTIPISYVLLKMGFPAYSVLLCLITIEIFATVIRIYLSKNIIGISFKYYSEKVLFKLIFPVILSISVCSFITSFFSSPIRFSFTIISSVILSSILMYLTGLEEDEKLLVQKMIRRFLKVLHITKS